MTTLPPNVQARIEQLVAVAPPLTPAQQDVIRRIFTSHGEPVPSVKGAGKPVSKTPPRHAP